MKQGLSPKPKKLLRIENYVGIVKKLAFYHWQRLPKGAKCWIDPDDLFTEGMAFVRYHLMDKYDPSTGNRFMTLLYKSLDRFYKCRGIELCRIKRTLPGPIDDEADAPAEDTMLLEALSGERGLVTVYAMASPQLRSCIEKWFFSTQGSSKVFRKVSSHSGTFQRAAKEFRRLAIIPELDIIQCRAFLDRRRREDYTVKELSDL